MAERRHKFAGLVPEMLVRSISEHRCVLFAGAGLSAQAQAEDASGLPTWGALKFEGVGPREASDIA
jgi:hypothetical protein